MVDPHHERLSIARQHLVPFWSAGPAEAINCRGWD